MANSFLFGFFALILLAQSPFVFAYDCSDVSYENRLTCLEIENSNLSLIEKQLLISNLEYANKYEPNHFFISSNNNNIIINNAPDGTKEYNSKYIKDAWIELFTVMPSVIYNNSLYVPSSTKVLTGFNYRLNAPTKNPVSGDCRTTYELLSNSAENKIYVNSQYAGSGKLVPITINQDSEIRATYNILVQYKIRHYEWYRYCCRRRKGRCTRRCTRCEYSHSEISRDTIRIEDSIKVKLYDNNLFAKVIDSSQTPHSSKIKLNYSDSIEVSFANSNYNNYKYIFEIADSFYPYNILTLKARDYDAEFLNNLYRLEDTLIVNNPSECKIRGFDFFNTIERSCSIEENHIGLKIKTDKLGYYEGEEIQVEIYPENTLINITYSNKSFLVKNKAQFIATKPSNKLIASYGWESSQKIIYIKNRSRLKLISNIFWLFIISIMSFAIIKKYWGKIWQNADY
jgi:hypothetical protein